MAHEGTSETIVQPGFEHAFFKAVAEAIDAVFWGGEQAAPFERRSEQI